MDERAGRRRQTVIDRSAKADQPTKTGQPTPDATLAGDGNGG